MRILAIGLTLALSITACTGEVDDADATAPVDDTGTTTSEDDTGDDTTDTGDDTTDTTDTGDDTTDTTDTGDDTTDTGDQPTVPDGKNGSPCETSADCASPDDYLCVFGLCAELCKELNAEETGYIPIPDTCGGVSNVSDYAAPWGCPEDLIICMPSKNYLNQNAICETNNDCESAIGPGFTCNGPIQVGGGIKMRGLCLPFGDRGAPGDPCAVPEDCASSVCLNSGVCSSLCLNNKHCPEGNLCMGAPFAGPEPTEADPEPPTQLFGRLCIPQEGSLTYCTKQATCPDGEVCNASIEPNTLNAQYHCITANAGGAEAGEVCAADADCYSGFCVTAGIDGGPAEGFCANACQKSPDDCPDTMNCSKLALHDSGTAELDDDKLYGLCVFGKPGEICTVSGYWCEEAYSVCEQQPDLPEGLGYCSEPATGCSDGGPPCNDGKSCTVDTCVEDTGECEVTELKEGTCLIGDECYADGDANPENACMVCDSATDTGAWTPAAEGAECTGDGVCLLFSCDGAGVCGSEPNTCDDGLDCTEDACFIDDGSCHNDIAAGSCLITGACYEDGAANPGSGCLICDPAEPTAWTDASDGTVCDDGVACNTASCIEGQCIGAPKDCDDGLACTTNACDADSGDCTADITEGCLIDGACVAEAATADGNACKVCTTATANDAWSDAADATDCDDGLECTTADKCATGQCVGASTCDDGKDCTTDDCTVDGCAAPTDAGSCLIADTCYEDGTENPLNECMTCAADTDQGIWTAKADDDTCSDGLDCTAGDSCQGGACEAGGSTCDDSKTCTDDACTEDGCTNTLQADHCLDDGACVALDDPCTTTGGVCTATGCQVPG